MNKQLSLRLAQAKSFDWSPVLLGGVIFAMLAAQAMAGTDTTFATAVTNVQNWIGGSLGKLCSLGALGIGLVIAIVKQSLMSVATGVGIALVGSVGPGILTGLLTATL